MYSDLRLALRTLAKTPGFTLVVLATLTLGIGVNSSMYSLMDVLLFRTVPLPEAGALRNIVGTSPQNRREGFSFAEAAEMREQAAGPGRAFESLTTYGYMQNTLAEPDRPAERFVAIDATADLFRTFRVQPMLGRAFTAEEQVPGRNRVALLSHRLWQSRFGGDPAVVGRTVRLNAEPVTIIGVMPASFVAPLYFGPVDLWRPITIARHIVEERTNRYFNVVGRLHPDVAPEQALAQLEPLAQRWARDYPQTSQQRGFKLMPPHQFAMDDYSVFFTWLLFGLGTAVLLVACANIANLQLARATTNLRDLAIRSALGASRPRLLVQQLVESLVLAAGGGLLGVLVGSWINVLLGRAIRLGDSGATLDLPMDARIVGATFAAALGTGLLFGLLPAWFASRQDAAALIKQQARGTTAGRGPKLLRQALIVTEIALAVALLGAAGVMIRGLGSMMQQVKGWDTRTLLAVNIHLPEQSTYATEDQRRLAHEKLLQRLAQIPGVEHFSISSNAPLFDYSRTSPFQIEGITSDDPTKQPSGGYIMAGPDYFATLGLPLKEGRVFPPDLRADSPPVVVINETMARHFWPGRSAIGQRIGEREGQGVVWREVIGVVGDLEFALSIANPSTRFQIYKPLVHEPWGYLFLLLRSPRPESHKQEVRQAVRAVDPDLAIQEMYTVPEAAERFQHNLIVINDTLLGFALVGLLLAAVGLYGVIATAV